MGIPHNHSIIGRRFSILSASYFYLVFITKTFSNSKEYQFLVPYAIKACFESYDTLPNKQVNSINSIIDLSAVSPNLKHFGALN